MKKKKEDLISDDSKKILRQDFTRLENPVTIAVFTDDRENKPFNEFSIALIKELAGFFSI